VRIAAAVVEAPGADPAVVHLDLRDPGPTEVLVRVRAAGVCHSDVAYARGDLEQGLPFPVVLGHETAGVVEAAGRGVRSLAVGDHVVVALTQHCGHCRMCELGTPMLCLHRRVPPGALSRDGEDVYAFAGGGFAEAALVDEASLVQVPKDVPFDVAAILGCAVATGLGAVRNIAQIQWGETAMVIGLGGVGLSAVLGAVVAGCSRVVAVDVDERRRAAALALGATDAVPPGEALGPVLEPGGFDQVIEAAGRVEAMQLAVAACRRGGTVTLVGLPHRDAVLTLPAADFVVSQRRLLGCVTGNVRPAVDLPDYVRLYQAGRLPLDSLVTSHLPLSDVSEAFRRCAAGEGVRTILTNP
jgi:alcohol dehydrogenase